MDGQRKFVWAKQKYCAFWPAEVVEAPPQITKIPRKKICVLFFGTNNYGPKNVIDYLEHRDKLAHLGKGVDFKNALNEIEDHMRGVETNPPNELAVRDGAIFVKMKDESNEVQLVRYNETQASNESANDERVVSELSKVRIQYSTAVFELQKIKESEASLKTENKLLLQKIESCNRFVGTLKSEKMVPSANFWCVGKALVQQQILGKENQIFYAQKL